MLILREIYKKRLQKLAGIINEVDLETKEKLFSKNNERFPYSDEIMKQAIKQGRELGMSFKSNNDKYQMPVYKHRVIRPVAMGISEKNNTVVRGLHVIGQSEKKARESGVRSAEAEGEWRLFNVDNISKIWFTGNFFDKAPNGFNPNDRGMKTIITVFNPSIAKAEQEKILKSQELPSNQEDDKTPDSISQQSNSNQVAQPQDNTIAPGQFNNNFAG